MEAPLGTTEVPEGSHPYVGPKYNEQTATIALGSPIAPLEETIPDNLDSLEVPRRNRSDLPRRRPGTAWYDSYQLSGPLPTYSGYASPSGPPAMGQAGSLKPEDEEEIAAALFDLAKTTRGAQSGLLAANEMNDSLILPSSRKRPRKPSRAGIKYETNYEDVFDDDWDAEDEYLAKRRGGSRPINIGASSGGGYHAGRGGGGHPNGNARGPYNNHGHINHMPGMLQNGNMGYPTQLPPAPRFKPGPNHVAISHFIQWHRQTKAAPQQPAYPPAAGSNFAAAAAAAAAALGRAQGIPQNTGGAVHPPGSGGGLDISALAALLPSLQAGLRQGASNNGPPGSSQLAGLLGQLVAGQQGTRQLSPETLNVLQQLLRRQQAQRQQQQQQQQQQPAVAMAQPAQAPLMPPANLPANLASVVARLKNAQAKAQGVAMASAATQGRPVAGMALPGDPSGALQNTTTSGQPSPAFLQSLKAMLAANAQRAQQGIGPASAPAGAAAHSSATLGTGGLPPSHAELLKVMKQSLDMAKSNNIGAWVAKKYQMPQQQQEAPNGVDATRVQQPGDAAPSGTGGVDGAAPAEPAPTVLTVSGKEAAPVQVKTENFEVEENARPPLEEEHPAENGDVPKESVENQISDAPIAASENGNTNDTTNPLSAVPNTSGNGSGVGDQVQEERNGAVPTNTSSVPPFQPAPIVALEAMRAYLLQQKQAMAPKEQGLDAEVAAQVNNGNNGNEEPNAS